MNKRLIFLIAIIVLSLWEIFVLLVMKGIIEVPSSFKVFSLTINLYSIFIVSAMIVMYLLFEKFKVEKKNLKKINTDKLFLIIIPFALIGARIWHVATDWQLYEQNPIEAFYIWNGGMGILGAVLFSLIGLAIFAKSEKKELSSIINILLFILPISQIIGRYGNLFNQELFGKPTVFPWGMYISVQNRPSEFINSEFFHPAFLYEQMSLATLIAINYFLYRKLSFSKNIYISTWLIGYGIIRFLVEFYRIDNYYLLTLSINQFASLFLIICGIIYLYYLKNIEKRKKP